MPFYLWLIYMNLVFDEDASSESNFFVLLPSSCQDPEDFLAASTDQLIRCALLLLAAILTALMLIWSLHL
ncbi:hypothetical protein L596_020257 [Steinernema carpocapsae]|uniref:Uncharacterized protein n=1 Tax=Steinernema carpocapsae TaxID=34508 RepID=A0A4U5MT71_STECR|nr:hypothetical protein L596_020257 [Steinernema carpocapsae]